MEKAETVREGGVRGSAKAGGEARRSGLAGLERRGLGGDASSQGTRAEKGSGLRGGGVACLTLVGVVRLGVGGVVRLDLVGVVAGFGGVVAPKSSPGICGAAREVDRGSGVGERKGSVVAV